MILLASFAAHGWSRTVRGAPGIASTFAFATTAVLLFAAFFTLRIADEHKDAATDLVARPELPVPRGLVTLAELRGAAAPLVLIALASSVAVSARLLFPIAAIAAWLALMTREFFAPDWLRARPLLYLLSHMVIMPLLLLAATAVDWIPAGGGAPAGLGWFLAASFATGLVLEIGRKIRSPGDERPGVDTYTSAWGVPRAITAWLAALGLSAGTIALTTRDAGAVVAPLVVVVVAHLLALPAVHFLVRRPAPRAGKVIEIASGAWTFVAYGCLALPWVERAMR